MFNIGGKICNPIYNVMPSEKRKIYVFVNFKYKKSLYIFYI